MYHYIHQLVANCSCYCLAGSVQWVLGTFLLKTVSSVCKQPDESRKSEQEQ